MSYYDNWTNSNRPDPTTGYSIVHFQGTNRLTPYNDFDSASLNNAYVQFKAIYFDNGAGAFSLGGQSIKLFSADQNLSATIANRSSSSVTIGFSSVLLESNTYISPSAGNIVVNSPVYADNGGGVLYVTANTGKTVTFNGAIGQYNVAGSLVNSDNNTIVLNNTNTYTGATSINAGTMLVNGSTSASSQVAVASGATLGGTGTVAGATTVASGGIITGGTNGTVGTLNLSAGLTINGTYVADISGATGDKFIVAGAVNATGALVNFVVNQTLTASTYVLATYTSIIGTFTSNNVPSGYKLDQSNTSLTLDLATVPEPGTYLGGLFLCGVVGYAQRRHLRGLWMVAGRR